MALTTTEKILLRAADVKSWMSARKFEMPPNATIARITRGSHATLTEPKRFVRKFRRVGYEPVPFGCAQFSNAIPQHLQNSLLREAQLLWRKHRDQWTEGDGIHENDKEESSLPQNAFMAFTKPYEADIAAISRIAHSLLRKTLEMHCNKHIAYKVDKELYLRLFEQTMNPSDPHEAVVAVYEGGNLRGLQQHCDKLPVWGAVVCCIQDSNCAEFEDGLVVYGEKDEDLIEIRTRDAVVISPLKLHSVPSVVRARNRFTIVISY